MKLLATLLLATLLPAQQNQSVRVRLLDDRGDPIHECQVTVRRLASPAGPGQTRGAAADDDAGPVALTAGGDGLFTLPLRKDGSQLALLDVRGYATACVPSDTGSEKPQLVSLVRGGAIEGFVADAKGDPIEGVEVTTLPEADAAGSDELSRCYFAGVTPRTVLSDAAGRYRLMRLVPGRYRIVLRHPSRVSSRSDGLQVRAGKTASVPPVVLAPGTAVLGTVSEGGRALASVKVVLAEVVATKAPKTWETTTGADGSFAFGDRVPPGHYQIMAARTNLPNPLLQIADYHQSKQDVRIGEEQAQAKLKLRLPPR